MRIFWGSNLNNPREPTSWEPYILAISRANGYFKSRWAIFTLSKKHNPNQIKYAVGVSEVTPAQQTAIDADPINIFYLNSTQIKQAFSTLPPAMRNRINAFCKQINLAPPANNEILYDLWNRMSIATANKTLTALETELDNDLKIARANDLGLVIVPSVFAIEPQLSIYRRQLLRMGLISAASYFLWSPKPACAAVVFTDNFNVAVNTALGSYPSGSPNYVFGSGDGALYVNAANDRIQQTPDSTADWYGIINASMPTGNQAITGYINSSGADGVSVGFLVRIDLATGDYYKGLFDPENGVVAIVRNYGGVGETTLASDVRAPTYPVTSYTEAIGVGATVTINAQAIGTAILTFSDTASDRLVAGVPGLYMRSGGFSSQDIGFIDDLSVDDLTSPAVVVRRRSVVVQ